MKNTQKKFIIATYTLKRNKEGTFWTSLMFKILDFTNKGIRKNLNFKRKLSIV